MNNSSAEGDKLEYYELYEFARQRRRKRSMARQFADNPLITFDNSPCTSNDNVYRHTSLANPQPARVGRTRNVSLDVIHQRRPICNSRNSSDLFDLRQRISETPSMVTALGTRTSQGSNGLRRQLSNRPVTPAAINTHWSIDSFIDYLVELPHRYQRGVCTVCFVSILCCQMFKCVSLTLHIIRFPKNSFLFKISFRNFRVNKLMFYLNYVSD
jgi:hypothetical protein